MENRKKDCIQIPGNDHKHKKKISFYSYLYINVITGTKPETMPGFIAACDHIGKRNKTGMTPG